MAKSPTVSLTADVVLLAMMDGEPHVLLIQRRHPPFQHCWALPGGYVDDGETSEQAAHRELAEETGIDTSKLVRLDVYDAPDRDPRGRVVSVAYTAVLDEATVPAAGDDAAEAAWVSLDVLLADPARLAFDHGQVVSDAARHWGATA